MKFFHQKGYVVAHGLLSGEAIAMARFGVARYHAGERDWMLPIAGGFLDWREEHPDGLRICDYVSLQCREFQELVMDPALGRAFAALAGASEIRLFHDQLISKSPGFPDRTAVGWHQDASYWNTCSSESMLTAWIPLEPYDLRMGPLQVIPGSHRWPGHEWMTTFNDQDLQGLMDRVRGDGSGAMPAPEPILIAPGDVSFHAGGMIHGSAQNLGTRPRVALTVHVQDGANRYKHHVDDRGRVAVHVNDALCGKTGTGDPDYADPIICPRLWPQ
ncbi:phytanoyl-CoA dioxygenase family protein [Rhodospirillum sp. A1_3_36]|uniref:phytanoyl-CoA dioxygenase family protein n=1 Tax=Rhodospirillum sp. A1_3_36 TaxID=3391666 RepID=UPI0039A619DE